MLHTLRVETLVRDLLLESTAALLDASHVAISRGELTLKEPCTELRAKL